MTLIDFSHDIFHHTSSIIAILYTCTTAIVYTCAICIVHACIIAIIHACTVAIVHACMYIVHAFTIPVVHAYDITIVHVSCPQVSCSATFMAGGVGGEAPLAEQGALGGRRPPNNPTASNLLWKKKN